MNRFAVAILLITAAAGHASAQSRTLRVESTTAPIQQVQGQSVISAAALTALDARVSTDGWQTRVALFDDTLVFFAHSAFFRRGTHTYQLSTPALPEGSTLWLPVEFFTDWLPAEYSKHIVYRAGALTRTAAAPGVAQRDSSSPNASGAGAPPKNAGKPVRVVVLDAGHGGIDSGKPGPNGLAEKTAALSVTNRLAGFLRERGYEVHLTRTSDSLIALADRPHFANEWKGARSAAVFVSIHANSGARSARGFETYFLSDARTEDERRVAEMENAAVQFEKRRDAAPELDQIVSSLKNDYYLRASNSLAEAIQGSLAAVHPGPNRGVKQAGFRVLVGALMPAVLVEMAFISNPEEARLLGTSAFQQKIAWSLAQAIDRFFDSHEHIWAAGPTQ